jgi:hypothetical protein
VTQLSNPAAKDLSCRVNSQEVIFSGGGCPTRAASFDAMASALELPFPD